MSLLIFAPDPTYAVVIQVEGLRPICRIEPRTGESSECYQATEGRLLGEEEFVKDVKHRIGEHLAARGVLLEDAAGATRWKRK